VSQSPIVTGSLTRDHWSEIGARLAKYPFPNDTGTSKTVTEANMLVKHGAPMVNTNTIGG